MQLLKIREAFELGVTTFGEFLLVMGLLVGFMGGFFVIPGAFIFFLHWLFS